MKDASGFLETAGSCISSLQAMLECLEQTIKLEGLRSMFIVVQN